MAFVQVAEGVQLFYQDRGKGRPILFVPGWSMNGDVFDYQVMDLGDRYRCITVDMRGHGRSDKPFSRYDYDEYCNDLRTMIRVLGLSDVTLVGWSMGGGICLKYVRDCREGVTGLVMASPAAPRFTQEPGLPYGLQPEDVGPLLEVERTNKPQARTGLLGNNFYQQGLEATRDWFIQISLQTPVHAGLRSFEAILKEDLRSGLDTIGVPTAIFHGAHDAVCDIRWSEYMAERIPGCKLVRFQESGHVTFVEERERFNQELAAFIG